MNTTLINEDLYKKVTGLCTGQMYLKIEGLNPAGSIKLKTAYSVIDDLEQQGKITPNTKLIESSSGNLGVALSMVCAERGYRFTCVIDPNTSDTNRRLIAAYGADVIVVQERDENGGYLQTRINTIRKLMVEHSNYLWINQYRNQANPKAHYCTTAPAIARQFPHIDYLFVGAGTTGTLMGCKKYFMEHRPKTKVIAVDSVGSITFGHPPSTRYIPGLGTSRLPEIFEPFGIHDKLMISESKAIQACRWMAQKYGLLTGGSTGTVMAAVRQYSDLIKPSDIVVAISPDLGERYLDTIYSDEWVKSRFDSSALLPFPEMTQTSEVA